ncbi:MAG: ferritin-like domain-containing protein [Longimicrobiales bacterium]
MKLESLRDLYLEQLRDLYDAEHRILDALPKMADAATHPELRDAFLQHERQTKEQKQRLEQVFEKLGLSPERDDCEAMKGLIKEGREVVKARGDDDAPDAALIAAAQRVEHYEIAGYGCARTYARMLGHSDQADLLQQTLQEEGSTDHRLTELAERVINIDALHA